MLPGPAIDSAGGAFAVADTPVGKWMTDHGYTTRDKIPGDTDARVKAAGRLILSILPGTGQAMSIHDIDKILDDPDPNYGDLSIAVASLVPGVGAVSKALGRTEKVVTTSRDAPDVVLTAKERQELRREIVTVINNMS